MIEVFKHELTVALDAARTAAMLINDIYASGFEVEWKGRGDPVTEADRRANTLITDALRAAFPHDGVCAEEGDAAMGAEAAARGGRCWFVDPLDGTQEFVHRNGEFCVMIGLAIDGRATLGVVVAPQWQRTLVGVVGEGAWELLPDGTRAALVPSGVEDPSAATFAVSRSHPSARIEALFEKLHVAGTRPCGSVGLKCALVATGAVSGYVHLGRGPKLWDGCAPEAIARAAGLTVTDAHGDALRYDTRELALLSGIVVASSALAARLVASLAVAEG
jgi:3'(2'), 5'-bisphosphate nucleotidase